MRGGECLGGARGRAFTVPYHETPRRCCTGCACFFPHVLGMVCGISSRSLDFQTSFLTPKIIQYPVENRQNMCELPRTTNYEKHFNTDQNNVSTLLVVWNPVLRARANYSTIARPARQATPAAANPLYAVSRSAEESAASSASVRLSWCSCGGGRGTWGRGGGGRREKGHGLGLGEMAASSYVVGSVPFVAKQERPCVLWKTESNA